jgi:hypothetical protein
MIKLSQEGENDVRLGRLFLIIFILCLIHSFWAISVGWNNFLLDKHDFRQTQTAISTFYILKNGFSLAYETPVLGLPWSIPMEFPIYQGIVALIARVSSSPLDQTGRFVSAFFFYLSLIPIYGVLHCLNISKSHRWIFLSLFVASPLYLFWSRTFMIESTALFFSLAYFFFVCFYFRRQSLLFALLAGLFATIGGLTKITTLIGFVILAILWTIANWFQKNTDRNLGKDLILPIIFFFILPYLVSKSWIDFADYQKALNPMADFLTSASLKSWNFGTISQKLSFGKWGGYLYRTTRDIFGSAVFSYFILVFLPFLTNRKILSLGASLVFILIVAVFTNLHFVHNYYPYGNGVFLIFAMGFIMTGLVERKQIFFKYFGLSLIMLILLLQLKFYRNGWYPSASNPSLGNYKKEISAQVRKLTSPNGILLIYGEDWNPSIPYYSQRRSLMVPEFLYGLDSVKKALKILSTSQDKIEAMILCNKVKGNQNHKEELLNLHGFKQEAIFSNERCAIYRK